MKTLETPPPKKTERKLTYNKIINYPSCPTTNILMELLQFHSRS